MTGTTTLFKSCTWSRAAHSRPAHHHYSHFTLASLFTLVSLLSLRRFASKAIGSHIIYIQREKIVIRRNVEPSAVFFRYHRHALHTKTMKALFFQLACLRDSILHEQAAVKIRATVLRQSPGPYLPRSHDADSRGSSD